MTIRDTCRAGGAAMMAVLLIGAIVTAWKIDTISIGGPLSRNIQIMNDIQADILPPPAYIIEPYLEATLLMRDPASLPARRKALAELEREFRASIARWRGSTLDDGLKAALVDRAAVAADRFWSDVDHKLLPAVERGDRAAAQAAYADAGQAYAAHRREIDRLVAAITVKTETVTASSQTTLYATLAILLAVGIALAAAMIGGIVYVLRGVLGPVGTTAETMRRMADGDLTIRLEGGERADEIGTMVSAVAVFRVAAQAQVDNAAKQEIVVRELVAALDELGNGNITHRIGDTLPDEYRGLSRSFNATMERLSATLLRVAESAGGVKTGASEVSAAADDLSQRTEQQAASLEETAAAMDEITAGVRETAVGATRANDIVATARQETERSGEVVRRAVDAMGAIERSSGEISEIITVIDGIAFQTNLLALNAGVEAARAGDAGKGFAVVASEVRALAQRSADAAKDVKERIMTSTAQVDMGVGLVSETGRSLAAISGRISEISVLVEEIAASAERQASGLQQVNTAVSEMDGTTQQNAAMVEEATAAARHLAEEADAMAREVAQFRLGGGEVARIATHGRAGAPKLALAS